MIEFSEIEKRITKGICIKDLEEILRPQKPFSNDKWRDTSTGGFLAPNEKLLDVVRTDYDTLCSLGKTYGQMAKLADDIERQLWSDFQANQKSFTQKIKDYVFSTKKPVIVNVDKERFNFLQMASFGSQSCPWGCTGIDEFGYHTSGCGHTVVIEKGKEKSNFMNSLSSFTVITGLTPHLIASHYFFEGNASYRTDPRKLLQLVK